MPQHSPSQPDPTPGRGLSSHGQIHNLSVNLEAISTEGPKAVGESLQIHYGIHNTTFGNALIATTSRGICNLHFLDAANQPTAKQTLLRQWPNAEIVLEAKTTQPLCDIIFNSAIPRDQEPLKLLAKGTNFQIQVWHALLKVPFGGTTTYQSLAEIIGRPTATRAVGNAIGNNPISYLIPCHRVIRASGELGGYRWGLERKVAILNWEASRISCTHRSLDLSPVCLAIRDNILGPSSSPSRKAKT